MAAPAPRRLLASSARSPPRILVPFADDLFPDLAEFVHAPAADQPAGGAQGAVGETGAVAGAVLQDEGVRLGVETELMGAGDRTGPVARHVDRPRPPRRRGHPLELQQRPRRGVPVLAVVDLVGPGVVAGLLRAQVGRP